LEPEKIAANASEHRNRDSRGEVQPATSGEGACSKKEREAWQRQSELFYEHPEEQDGIAVADEEFDQSIHFLELDCAGSG
jgi:hypothetical protein